MICLSEDPETGGTLMVMALARCGSLDQMRYPQKHWRSVLRHADWLTDQLRNLHALGYIHRDLHPGNVMFLNPSSNDDPDVDCIEPYLIDVGVSYSTTDVYGHRGAYGRLEYLPPEVFEAKPQTQPSDVYCLGTLLWQLVVGSPPRGISSTAVRDNPGGLREELIPGAPSWFNDILRSCWNPDPDQRPSAASLWETVQVFLHSLFSNQHVDRVLSMLMWLL